MCNEKESILKKFKPHMPKEYYRQLKIILEKENDICVNDFYALKLKNTYVTVILSILFGIFGVDRFYAGDIKIGIGKMLLGIIGYVFGGFGTIGFALRLLSYVWWIEDIFVSYRLGRIKNAETITAFINKRYDN